MECRDARELLTAHVDGELSGREALEVARHVEGCAECASVLASLAALRRAIGSDATRFRASARLAHRVRAALPAAPERGERPTLAFWRRLAAGGSFAALLAVGLATGLLLMRPSASDVLAEDIVSSHVRSLLAARPVDVASSDRHTVKPWFAGKLDYAPPVHDLAQLGFPLEGGRVDYIGHRPVAALVYRHHQHTINLYVLPVPGGTRDTTPQSETRQGFHLVHWVRDGMAYWAISDVDAAELGPFRAALDAQGS